MEISNVEPSDILMLFVNVPDDGHLVAETRWRQ
jgi:hypothetical protein